MPSFFLLNFSYKTSKLSSSKKFSIKIILSLLISFFILSNSPLWVIIISASSGILATDELTTSISKLKSFILFLKFVAPIALDPIPTSHANTIFFISLISKSNSCTFSLLVFLSSFSLYFLFNKNADIKNETIAPTQTPNKFVKISLLWDSIIIEKILPGDAVAINPELKVKKVIIETILPIIAANNNDGFINMYGKYISCIPPKNWIIAALGADCFMVPLLYIK